MFTGLVEELGAVRAVRRGARSCVLDIGARVVLGDLAIGDSVAVNGVCLTATSVGPTGFTADVMPETLGRSSLASARPGTPVNLERAMAAGGHFGGHIVSGHIDGTGTVAHIERDDNAVWFSVRAPRRVLALVVEKGSIAIDGTSLTVARVDDAAGTLSVSIIPHTFDATTLGRRHVGDAVNLEADLVGKYVARLLGVESLAGAPGASGPLAASGALGSLTAPSASGPGGCANSRDAPTSRLDLDLLARAGFA